MANFLPSIPCRKVMVVMKEPISAQGLKRWPSYMQKSLHKFVFKSKGSHLMPYSVCKTRKEFAEWVYNTAGIGISYIYIWRKGYYKNKDHLRPYRIAIIENRTTKDGDLITNYLDLSRISKFSWFEPDKKQKKHENVKNY